MSMNTVLLAISSNDEHRIDGLIDTAASVVGPDGTVVLLHVFDREQYDDIETQLHIDANAEVTPDDISERSRIVNDAAERLAAADIDYVVRGALGDATDAILRQRRDEDADLIVVGGRNRSATGKALFGSTAQQVLLRADVPVTFVKEQATETREEAVPA